MGMHLVTITGEAGPVEVPEDSLLTFPEGLVGCPDWQRFALVSDSPDSPVALMQCLDADDACFLVTDPRHIWPDYAPAMTQEQLAQIGATRADQVEILCTLRTHDDGSVTANLLGPLAVNTESRLAVQIVQFDTDYSTQELLPAAFLAEMEPVLV
jgi:flagellar assembly factor FliW